MMMDDTRPRAGAMAAREAACACGLLAHERGREKRGAHRQGGEGEEGKVGGSLRKEHAERSDVQTGSGRLYCGTPSSSEPFASEGACALLGAGLYRLVRRCTRACGPYASCERVPDFVFEHSCNEARRSRDVCSCRSAVRVSGCWLLRTAERLLHRRRVCGGVCGGVCALRSVVRKAVKRTACR